MTTRTHEAHRWFRKAGAPLIIPARVRFQGLLARSVPVLTWVSTSCLVYLLLWGQLITYVDDDGTEVSGIQLSDDLFLLLLLAITFLPPLLLLALPWWLSRHQKRYPLWAQNLAGGVLSLCTVFALSPSAARLFGATDLAEMASVPSTLLTVAGLLLAVFGGLDSLLIWVVRQTRYELLGLVSMVSKVLPVLMVAVLFFFVNGDIWRVADALSLQRTWQVVAVLAALSSLVIFSTVMEKTQRVLGARKGDKLEEYNREGYTLAAQEAGEGWERQLASLPSGALKNPAPLGRAEWYNLVSLPIVVQGIQALFFGVLVCLFFIWFGMIAIPDATVASWLTHATVKASFAGVQMPFSTVLVKVSMVLGGFAALSFVAQTSSDQRYADEFLRPALEELRRTVMIRNIYRVQERR